MLKCKIILTILFLVLILQIILVEPLTDQQKQNNRIKSKTRARVEHIFGFVENSMNGSVIRTIGKVRAEAQIGLMNLTYNLFRCIQLNVIL